MAIRRDELHAPPGARIYRFPTGAVRARARRRRIVARLRLGAVALAAVVGVVVVGGPEGPATASRSKVPAAVVVAPGETLWDLAERYAPAATDRRAFVDGIVELNRLEGAAVSSGRRLLLPR